MTLETARELLQQQGLAFTQTVYDSQTAFWQQMCQVPPAAADQSDRVAALELPSNNGRTKLVLEFHETARGALLEDLWFGGYSFELFDLQEESLPEELGRCMAQIMRGELVFVCAYDLKKQMRRADAAYDCSPENPASDLPGLQRALRRIEKKKSRISRWLGRKILYEIYDWNTYRAIVK